MLKKRVTVRAAVFLLMLAYFIPTVQANVEDENALALARKNACLGCHAVNKKIVGPSFQAVAEKYKGNANAQSMLKNKIAMGGSGSWGVVPMPPNAKLSDADLTALTSWVLRGAPSKN